MSVTACGDDFTYESRVREWARDVLLGVEFGDPTPISRRWAQAPTISLMAGNGEHSVLVNDVVAELNRFLEPVFEPVERIQDDSDGADVRVYFVDLDRFDDIARRENTIVVPDNLGQFYIRWDETQTIFDAVVLIARDRLQGALLRHLVYEEITQALGPLNDSAFFQDSIFFSASGSDGTAQRLSPEDRWLLQFLYRDLNPGASVTDLRRALDARLPAALQGCDRLGC
ncbi:MAG: DUF2927 domain-containing protein [Myxococcota bacterium]